MSEPLSRELQVIQQELSTNNTSKKIQAIHKVISYMNMGKNVSGLFFSVMKCLEIPNAEIKKLVYLYITQYSQELPDEAIMVVNSFINDARDKRNPMVRAMALRTMGCLRVKELNEYLIMPLKEALTDEDSYVQKTAVMTVAKIYEQNPELVKKNGLIQILQEILIKNKQTVVLFNTLLTLSEIENINNEKLIKPNFELIQKILNCLGESSDWGQISMMEIIFNMNINDKQIAEIIVDRCLSRLSHINPAVILSSIKVILQYTLILNNDQILQGICNKIKTPLVSLISKEDCSGTWVLLKNISILIEKFPMIFDDVRVFFVRYQEPSYIKIEKLKIISKLANDNNMKLVINELIEYSYDLDLNFSRKAVLTIWNLGIQYSQQIDTIISALTSIFLSVSENSFANHIFNEIIIGLGNLYRKYQKKAVLNSSVKLIAQNYERINEEQSLIQFFEIAQDFLDIIDNKEDIHKTFLQNFSQYGLSIQNSILTLTIKIYINDQDIYQESMTEFLQWACDHIDNPDLRDRVFFYWRLLTINQNVARKILYAQKSTINYKTQKISNDQINNYFNKLGTLAVDQENPDFGKHKYQLSTQQEIKNEIENLLNLDDQENQNEFLDIEVQQNNIQQAPQLQSLNDDDLLGLFVENKTPIKQQTDNQNLYNQFDFLGTGTTMNPINSTEKHQIMNINKQKNEFNDIRLTPQKNQFQIPQQKLNIQNLKQNQFLICMGIDQKGKNGQSGVQIIGCVKKIEGMIQIDLNITNFNQNSISYLKSSIENNCFGLYCREQQLNVNIQNGQTYNYKIDLIQNLVDKIPWKDEKNTTLNIKLETNIDEFNFCLFSSLLPFIVSQIETLLNN